MKVKGLLITGHEPPPTPPPHTAVYTTRITNTLPVWLHPKIHLQRAYLWASQLIKKILTTKKKKKKKWTGNVSLSHSPSTQGKCTSVIQGCAFTKRHDHIPVFAMVILHSALCQPEDDFVWPDQRKTRHKIHNLQLPLRGEKKKIVLETTSGISCLLRLPFAL